MLVSTVPSRLQDCDILCADRNAAIMSRETSHDHYEFLIFAENGVERTGPWCEPLADTEQQKWAIGFAIPGAFLRRRLLLDSFLIGLIGSTGWDREDLFASRSHKHRPQVWRMMQLCGYGVLTQRLVSPSRSAWYNHIFVASSCDNSTNRYIE